MPAPTNERQALERERAELQEHIATYQRELEAAPAEQKARRERLQWQIRRDQKRMVEVQRRLAGACSTADRISAIRSWPRRTQSVCVFKTARTISSIMSKLKPASPICRNLLTLFGAISQRAPTHRIRT